MPPKARKRRSAMQRDRAESGRPDSLVTTAAAAPSRGGDSAEELVATAASSSRGGDDGVEELQQQTNGKKTRLVWTPQLHDKFLRACRSLGRGNLVPKKILAVMDVKGLTRDNVSSHLQKYRQNLQGKGQAIGRRGNGGRTMMHHTAPSLQPAFPRAQPVDAAVPPAPSPSASVNPPVPPQGSFAATNMYHPQIGHGQGQIVQALPSLVHPPHENFPAVLAPMPQLFCPPPQFQDAIEWQQMMIMEQQAQHAAVESTRRQAAVAPGHNLLTVEMNYELSAQTLDGAPAAATGVQSHRLQPSMQAPPSPAVSMSGGLCSVPQDIMRDEETETRMSVPQLQTTVEPEAAGQVPAAEPAFAGSADPDDGGQHEEDSCGVLRFWFTATAPSMDNELPPMKPT